jgi:hypothetical protein
MTVVVVPMEREALLYRFNTPLYSGVTQANDPLQLELRLKVVRECRGVIDCFVFPMLLVVVYDTRVVENEFDIDDVVVGPIMDWATQQAGFFPRRDDLTPTATRNFAEKWSG